MTPPSEDEGLRAEVERLKAAIRAHRDRRGDDRCWLDDLELYAALGEGDPDPATLQLPSREEFLESCRRFHARRQQDPDAPPSPDFLTIAQLQAMVGRDHPPDSGAAIDDEWLRSLGFRWETIERSPHPHWTLWIGDEVPGHDFMVAFEDLGLELSRSCVADDRWHCWFRSDLAGRYGRFLHVRHLRARGELRALYQALTGRDLDGRPARVKAGRDRPLERMRHGPHGKENGDG
jgi:hypothetical protein